VVEPAPGDTTGLFFPLPDPGGIAAAVIRDQIATNGIPVVSPDADSTTGYFAAIPLGSKGTSTFAEVSSCPDHPSIARAENRSATDVARRYSRPMRILAIDYGSTRIGVALGDPTGTLARPLPFLNAKADPKLAREIAELAVKEQAGMVILGLPRNMDGSSGEAADKVKVFAEELRKSLGATPLKLIDERLSTVQASRQLQQSGKNARKQRDRIDSEAASVLLQSYLDSQQRFSLLPPEE